MAEIYPINLPRLNVNDEDVWFVKWLVEHGDVVKQGDPICEVETTKVLTELMAENGGVVYHDVAAQSSIKVNQRIGWIGPNLEAIKSFSKKIEMNKEIQDPGTEESSLLRATPRARALALRSGVPLERVASIGVKGTLKEEDVQRYLSTQSKLERVRLKDVPTELPPTILNRVVREGKLSRHELIVAEGLKQSNRDLLLATVDAEVNFAGVHEIIESPQESGMMISILHAVLCALGHTLSSFPRLISFLKDEQVYRYQKIDIAFVVRTEDRRLFTPVVRDVDKLNIKETAQACFSAAMRVSRGQIRQEELEGACFTVSHIGNSVATRFFARPNQFQSSILAIANERTILALNENKVTEIPVRTVTLTYDHSLCDGVYVAEFFERLIENLGKVS